MTATRFECNNKPGGVFENLLVHPPQFLAVYNVQTGTGIVAALYRDHAENWYIGDRHGVYGSMQATIQMFLLTEVKDPVENDTVIAVCESQDEARAFISQCQQPPKNTEEPFTL